MENVKKSKTKVVSTVAQDHEREEKLKALQQLIDQGKYQVSTHELADIVIHKETNSETTLPEKIKSIDSAKSSSSNLRILKKL